MRIRLLVNSDPGHAGKQYPSLTVNEKMNDLDTSSGLEKKKPVRSSGTRTFSSRASTSLSLSLLTSLTGKPYTDNIFDNNF